MPTIDTDSIDEPAEPAADADRGAPHFRDALAAVQDDLARIQPTKLLPVNLDVTAAAVVAIGAAAEVRRFRAELVAEFGQERAAAVDRLELVARAAAAAHGQYVAFSSGEDLLPISAAVLEVRTQLVNEVQSLIARKRLPKGALSRLRGANGYRNQIADMLFLTSLLEGSWPAITGFTGLRLADLHRAEGLTNELSMALGMREQGMASPSADQHRRAYTLFVTTYDGIRRMISFLRWEEGDADRIAPPLSAGRKRRRVASDGPVVGSDLAPQAAPELLGGNPFPGA